MTRPPPLLAAGGLQLASSSVTDPVAADLVRRTEAELCARYDVPSIGVLRPEDFEPAAGGLFLVARLDGTPVACGGYRRLRAEVAELKRLYVVGPARRRGVAAAILDHLEAAAEAAGYHDLWLETGTEQPEAMALYRARGYRSRPAFWSHSHPVPPGGTGAPGPADDGCRADGCGEVHDSRARFFGIALDGAEGGRRDSPAGEGADGTASGRGRPDRERPVVG